MAFGGERYDKDLNEIVLSFFASSRDTDPGPDKIRVEEVLTVDRALQEEAAGARGREGAGDVFVGFGYRPAQPGEAVSEATPLGGVVAKVILPGHILCMSASQSVQSGVSSEGAQVSQASQGVDSLPEEPFGLMGGRGACCLFGFWGRGTGRVAA